MKVLFVTERFPFPLDTGGNVRTFHVLKALGVEHEVTLIASARDNEVESRHVRVLEGICRAVRVARVPRESLARSAMAFARSLRSEIPFIVARHYREQMAAAIRDACASDRFDVVHWNHLDASAYARVVPEYAAQVLDEHNVVTNQVVTAAAVERRVARRLVLSRELAKIRRFEARVCNSMRQNLVCSTTDAEYLRRMGVERPIAVVPNGVDVEYFAPRSALPSDGARIAFVGTLDFGPCERAVEFFCTEILPRIRRKIGTAGFIIIGRNPTSRIRALAAADRSVVLTGTVDDVRPHVQSCQVSVAPILDGSGTRLKILEAMAMGLPVVSTSLGAEGIEARHGEHLLLADTPEEFASAVVEVLSNPDKARRLGVGGRELVEDRYSWSRIGRELLRDYRSLGGVAA